jgi:hypothetical protein
VAERRAAVDPWFTPRRVFGGLALLLFIALLFTPSQQTSEDAGSLSSYSTDPNGTRGLHDALQRLGFRVERGLRPMRQALDPQHVYFVLDPVIELTAGEVHNLLEAVRAGGGLLVVPSRYERLEDSLHVTRVPAPMSATDLADRDSLARFGQGRYGFVLRTPLEGQDSSVSYRAPAGAVTFLTRSTNRGREPVMVGVPYGRGRLVMAADPDFFQNSVVRQGDAAVRAVRMVEWLLAGDRSRTLVFDEYHHGFGMHADIMRVTRRALFDSAPGRVVLVLTLALLLLFFAVGVRPIRPRVQLRIERRSALEHVGALARAYAAVHASSRAARLLVRGLRRRHGGLRTNRDDAAYLRSIAERKPALRDDVEHLVTAMEGNAATSSDATLAAAVRRIEQAITPA